MDNGIAQTVASYTAILVDILKGKDLDKHKVEVEKAIFEIDKSINSAKEAGTPYDALDRIKNLLYQLKYEILERT
jgi:hypothetical protein